MTVSLVDKDVDGAEIVQIAFDDGDMRCQDGENMDPKLIELGASVAFRRVGDGVDQMSPPIISAREVVVDCA
jgi:hypothetical protein